MSASIKANKIESTWQMGKTAVIVCSSVLATAAISGYGVLKLVKFGGQKGTLDAVGVLINDQVLQLKSQLETRVDEVIDRKDKEEAEFKSQRKIELEEKARRLDKREVELEAREALVSAKEAARRQQPKD